MNEQDKKDMMEDFKKADGAKRLDMWDYACEQQIIWEKILNDMQKIAHEQGIDKKLDDLIEEEMKKAEQV